MIGLFYGVLCALIAHKAIFCCNHDFHIQADETTMHRQFISDINSINSTEINNMFTCVALNSISLLAVENKLPCAFFIGHPIQARPKKNTANYSTQMQTHTICSVRCIVAFDANIIVSTKRTPLCWVNCFIQIFSAFFPRWKKVNFWFG